MFTLSRVVPHTFRQTINYFIPIIVNPFIIRHSIHAFWWWYNPINVIIFLVTPTNRFFRSFRSRLRSFQIRRYKINCQTFSHKFLINYHKSVQRNLLSTCFTIENIRRKNHNNEFFIILLLYHV